LRSPAVPEVQPQSARRDCRWIVLHQKATAGKRVNHEGTKGAKELQVLVPRPFTSLPWRPSCLRGFNRCSFGVAIFFVTLVNIARGEDPRLPAPVSILISDDKPASPSDLSASST